MELPKIVSALAEWSCCLFFLFTFRKDQRKKPLAFILSFLLLFLLIGFQEFFCTKDNVYWLIGMFGSMVSMIGYFLILMQFHAKEALYNFARVFVTAEFLASCLWQLFCMFAYTTGWKSIWVQFIFLFLGAVAFFILLLLVLQEENRDGYEVHMDWHQTLLSLIIAYVSFIFSNIWFLSRGESMASDDVYQFLRTTVAFAAMLILFFQFRSIVDRQMDEELKSISNALNLQYKQYLEFKETSEYIGRQCHDLKHQINAIRNACSSQEREDYLCEMEEAVLQYETWNVSGNSILDTILTQKMQYCTQHKIQLTCVADGRALGFMAVRDICSIFGNLLDNAIEAVSLVEEEDHRLIHGEVSRKKNFLIIKFENCYEGNYSDEKNLPRTTKQDKTRHGYGLKSIRHVVEKYDGTMKLQLEEDWFVVNILIPVSE